MDYYLDIHIQPDAELSENFLLNKVYTKFHKALFDLQADDIGVSFPEYRIKLGQTLRIHSTEPRLTQLQQLNWLGGLSGYCKVSAIQPIPSKVMYRTVSRVQTTMTSAKLQRLIKRGTIAENDIKQYKAKMFQKQQKMKLFQENLDSPPYLELESASNGHLHRRYIEFGALTETPIPNRFNHFGLSKIATIPWF